MENIKDVFEQITKLLETEKTIKSDIKTIEKEIKEEYATIKGYRKKNGDVDIGAVKSTELKNAIKRFFLNDQSFDIKITNYEQYLTDMKNGEENFPLQKAKQYLQKEEVLTDFKEEFKEFEANIEADEKLNIDKDTFTILTKIAKMRMEEKSEKEIEKQDKIKKILEILND